MIDARNDLVALEVEVPCEGVRDQTVMIFDLLIQVLTEHFPLICDSSPERNAPPVDPRVEIHKEQSIEQDVTWTKLIHDSEAEIEACKDRISRLRKSIVFFTKQDELGIRFPRLSDKT